MTGTTYTVTAKRWEGGWELHIDGIGVTQSRTLANAAQQVSDYIATLTDADVAPERIRVLPDLSSGLLAEADKARIDVRAAAAAQEAAARRQREVARRLREEEHLSVTDTATVMNVSRGRVSQLTKGDGASTIAG